MAQMYVEFWQTTSHSFAFPPRYPKKTSHVCNSIQHTDMVFKCITVTVPQNGLKKSKVGQVTCVVTLTDAEK